MKLNFVKFIKTLNHTLKILRIKSKKKKEKIITQK